MLTGDPRVIPFQPRVDVRRSRARGRRRGPELSAHPRRGNERTYLKHALSSPYNVVPLVMLMGYALIGGTFVLVLLGIALELLTLVIVPRIRPFQQAVDAEIAEAERAAAARSRAALLMQMDDLHRDELERLERLTDRIREQVARDGEMALSLEEYLGLSQLTASYARFAILWRTGKEALAITNREHLVNEVRTLEQATAEAGAKRPLSERRLSIALRRLERWDRTNEEVELLAQQLAMIRDLIHLLYETALTPNAPASAASEIESRLRGIEEMASTIRELSSLNAGDGIDARTLELGRLPHYLHRPLVGPLGDGPYRSSLLPT